MGSWSRARSCINFTRGWRTACSCLQSRFLLLLIVIYILHCSQSQAKYIDDIGSSSTYYTFSCNRSDWCGENWTANQILRYGYNYTDTIEQQNKVHVEHRNNCSGVQDSLECQSRTTVRNETRPTRVQTSHRQANPEITKLPAMNLYLITTDNINGSNVISDKYDANQDKIWQIHIPKHCKMTVYFSQFDLEVSDRCNKDSFSVQTSKNQEDIYRYCNELHRIEVKRKRRVQMTFHADPAIEQSGIKATVCLSNLHDAVSDDELNQRLPCTCSPQSSSRRRKKNSQTAKKLLKRKIADEEARISLWLDTLMEGGQTAVDNFLTDTESSHKQRHLAELYREVLSKHREW